MSNLKYTHTNVTAGAIAAIAAKNIASAASSILGVPQVSTVTNAMFGLFGPQSTLYATSPLTQRYTLPQAPINDFRTRYGIQGIGNSFNVRLDGAALVQRNGANNFSAKAITYAALSLTPGGVYSTIGLNSFGKFGYGWGDHGNPDALRNDFTKQSHLATTWSYTKPGWIQTKNPISKITPFRGDKVNIIDYQKSTSLKRVYTYKSGTEFFGRSINGADQTKDFIKFFLTGPKLAPYLKDVDVDVNDISKKEENAKKLDDVIVFRATIGSISDQFQPQWTPVQLVGRADPNYHYSGYSRDISLDFKVYATDRDEMKPIWRKLNALAGYTAPDYTGTGIGFKAPWMRVTIGDLFYQVPVVISSLSYTLGSSDTPWEINIEEDPEMMEVPMYVEVSIAFHLIGEWLPQKNGQFYSLSKRFDEFGSLPGDDNWLSDSKQIDDNNIQRKGLNPQTQDATEQEANNATESGTTGEKDKGFFKRRKNEKGRT